MTTMTYVCGGCKAAYVTDAHLSGMERSKCPRCNPTSLNEPTTVLPTVLDFIITADDLERKQRPSA